MFGTFRPATWPVGMLGTLHLTTGGRMGEMWGTLESGEHLEGGRVRDFDAARSPPGRPGSFPTGGRPSPPSTAQELRRPLPWGFTRPVTSSAVWGHPGRSCGHGSGAAFPCVPPSSGPRRPIASPLPGPLAGRSLPALPRSVRASALRRSSTLRSIRPHPTTPARIPIATRPAPGRLGPASGARRIVPTPRYVWQVTPARRSVLLSPRGRGGTPATRCQEVNR